MKINFLLQERVKRLAGTLHQRMRVDSRFGGNPVNVDTEIEYFLLTGNLEPRSQNETSAVNPTLENSEWKVNYFAIPFDAYFPIPFDEQLSPDFESETSGTITAFVYCKMKLQSLISKLRSNKSRIVFYFHFGSGLNLCLGNQKLQNRFQIVHCSDLLVDGIGLANLLPAVVNCLVDDMSEALLLT